MQGVMQERRNSLVKHRPELKRSRPTKNVDYVYETDDSYVVVEAQISEASKCFHTTSIKHKENIQYHFHTSRTLLLNDSAMYLSYFGPGTLFNLTGNEN